MLELTDLRVFTRIVELGSISGAARGLEMPKSSVSRSLARLEGSVGAVLLERSTRHLRLTDAGLLLQRHARRILDDVGEAEDAIEGLVGVARGTLRVSVPFSFAAGPLAPMLPAFRARYPEVRVVLIFENQPIGILSDEADVAIRIGPLPDSDLIARRLARIPLWPCASPAYLAEHGTPTTVNELDGHALIAVNEHPATWLFRTPHGLVRELVGGSVMVVPEPAVLKTVLSGGAGIGRLPFYHAIEAIADGSLVRLLPDHACETVDAQALYPRHRSLSARVRVFVDELAAHLARTGGEVIRGLPALNHATVKR